jgi:hypothetical protein
MDARVRHVAAPILPVPHVTRARWPSRLLVGILDEWNRYGRVG